MSIAMWLAIWYIDSILPALCDLVWLGVSYVQHGTATVSSPATLLVSRNVAIDCVQLQVRVHSAQQRSRALLASLLLSKMSVSFASITVEPFFPPAPKLPQCLDQSDCSLHLSAATPPAAHRHGDHSVLLVLLKVQAAI